MGPRGAAKKTLLTSFGKYLLDEEIARGGMARVYLARLRGLGGFEKTLVVKQVLPELASDPRFVSMFVEEAKTLVQMSHPHIVPVYELGVVDGTYFLAMEYVEGATLSEILDEGGPLAPELVAHIGIQVCDALGYAHERFGLVHRDVTPRNVIVDSSGHVRLLDFGIAAPAEDRSEDVFGSVGYMAPEQAAGDALGPSADLFALGVVLFEATTGEPAFSPSSIEEARETLLNGELPSLGSLGPEGLSRVVDSMLEREADQRPEKARDVARRLRGWLAASQPEGVAPELGGRAEAARRRRMRRPSSRPPPARSNGGSSGGFRSLATSVALERLMQPEAPRAPVVEAAASTPPAAQTAARPAAKPTAVVEGTARIEGRGGRSRTDDGATAPRSEAPTSRNETSTSRSMLALGGVLLVGIVATIGVVTFASPSSSPGTATRDLPQRADNAPTQEPTDQDQPRSVSERAEVATRTATNTPSAPPVPVRAGDSPARIERVPQEQPAAQGTLTVSASPWATVRIGRRSIGETPRRAVAVATGAHQLSLDCPPLGTSVTVPVRVAEGVETRVIADMTQNPPAVTVR